jgi:hypothetical protein
MTYLLSSDSDHETAKDLLVREAGEANKSTPTLDRLYNL